MKRYVVTNQSSSLNHPLCGTVAEAIAAAIKLQDEGIRVIIVDAQGSGVITAGHFDVREAEGYLGRGLGSEDIGNPVLASDVIAAAQRTAPDKHVYHWDGG
jgi:cysteine synthase